MSTRILMVATLLGGAFGVEVVKLPPPGSLDAEVAVHYALAGFDNTHFLDFSLHFNGTSSNNVEVAFGADVDGDGELALQETDMRIGWDCGCYFAENTKTGETFIERNVGSGCIGRSLSCHFQINADGGSLKSFAATNEYGMAFADFSKVKPNWLYGRNWNLMRLTARGVDVQDEFFDIKIRRRRIVIFLK